MFVNQLIVTVGLLDMDRLLLEVFSICFTILPLQSIGTSAKQNEGEIVDILFANATHASLNFRVLLTTILQPWDLVCIEVFPLQLDHLYSEV